LPLAIAFPDSAGAASADADDDHFAWVPLAFVAARCPFEVAHAMAV
jgi:hypothetical protein